MNSLSLLALLVLVAGVSAQCWGGNCGCIGNNCGPQVTVVRVPNNNNGCSCNPCFGNGCAPRCSYCNNNNFFGGYSSCCNSNNFSCCGYRFRRSIAKASSVNLLPVGSSHIRLLAATRHENRYFIHDFHETSRFSLSLVGLALCQNATKPATYCKTQSRSECFLGSCPSGFECIGNQCCAEADVVQPGGDCTDFLADCSNIDCNAIGMQDFARANCARTCNLCYSTAPVSPQYACTDLLTDCANRTSSCQDIDFVDMMALYCPRTCSLCLWQAATKISNCGNQLPDCSTRGNYCSATSISDYQKRVGCGNFCGLCTAAASTSQPLSTNSNGFLFFGGKRK